MTLPMLTFHALDDQKSVLSFSPKFFRAATTKLHENCYQTIRVKQLVHCLNQSDVFPERSIAITFDDGYQSVYENAFHILCDYGMTATIFLTVGTKRAPQSIDRLPSPDGRPMLNWNQIREMHRRGFDFGAHTLTHPDLTRLSPKQAENEMSESKRVIEEQIGAKVDSFAYPYGRYNAVCRTLASHLFSCACTDKMGVIDSHSDSYALERIDSYYLRAPRAFDLLFGDFFSTYIRALGIPRNLRRSISRALTPK